MNVSRVNRLLHNGKPIIHIDLSNLKPGEFKPVYDEAMRLLAAAPLGTARVVTDVEGARFDPASIAEIEHFIKIATPHCAANAVLGVTGIKHVAWVGIRAHYKCPSKLCASMEAGKDWVAGFGS